MALYLTPSALGYLTQLVMALCITGYMASLVWRSARRQALECHVVLFTAFFGALFGFLVLLFLEAALPPSPRLFAVFLQVPFLVGGWIFLLQFSYHFPVLPTKLRREARWSLFASGLYALWEIGYAAYRFARLRAGVLDIASTGPITCCSCSCCGRR